MIKEWVALLMRMCIIIVFAQGQAGYAGGKNSKHYYLQGEEQESLLPFGDNDIDSLPVHQASDQPGTSNQPSTSDSRNQNQFQGNRVSECETSQQHWQCPRARYSFYVMNRYNRYRRERAILASSEFTLPVAIDSPSGRQVIFPYRFSIDTAPEDVPAEGSVVSGGALLATEEVIAIDQVFFNTHNHVNVEDSERARTHLLNFLICQVNTLRESDHVDIFRPYFSVEWRLKQTYSKPIEGAYNTDKPPQATLYFVRLYSSDTSTELSTDSGSGALAEIIYYNLVLGVALVVKSSRFAQRTGFPQLRVYFIIEQDSVPLLCSRRVTRLRNALRHCRTIRRLFPNLYDAEPDPENLPDIVCQLEYRFGIHRPVLSVASRSNNTELTVSEAEPEEAVIDENEGSIQMSSINVTYPPNEDTGVEDTCLLEDLTYSAEEEDSDVPCILEDDCNPECPADQGGQAASY